MPAQNPTDIFDISSCDPGTVAVYWDPAVERFVRLTVSATGRILARAELEPTERRSVLRYLIATRTQVEEQRAMAVFLGRLGLVAGAAIALPDADRPPVVEALTRRFAGGFTMPDVERFANYMEIGIRSMLVLAWAVALVRAVPGQALPRLEDLDADLPWMPPMGLSPAGPAFDARSMLDEIEAEQWGDDEPQMRYRHAGR